MKITEGIELDPREFRKQAGLREATPSVSPEQYAKAKPKVLKALQSAGDWVKRDTNSVKGDDVPRRAFIAAMNLVSAAEDIVKALGDDGAVRAMKAAQEAARKSAVQWSD